MFKKIINKFENNEIDIYQAVLEIDKYQNQEDRKSSGIVYTPKYIADFIIKNINYNLEETILEPSVGHGIFIFSLIEHVENKFKLNPNQLKNWFENKVFGIDINKKNIEDLKILLNAYFYKKGVSIITDNFIVGDGLFDISKTYDCIIGNPPYIRTKNLEKEYLEKLRKNYKSMESGNVDIYYAFIEHAHKNSKKSSYIVPNSYIYNKSATSLRNIILNDMVSIIDFKNTLIFENANTYTSIFYMNKEENSENILYKNKIEDNYIEVDKTSIKAEHWLFNDCNIGENKIEDFCRIKSGIATLKDKVYIIENPLPKKINNTEYVEHSYLNKKYLIEKEFLLDFYKITKLNKNYKIIYPYNKNNKIIEEDYIELNYPSAYEFLKECRVDLEQRDKGKVDKYESWYAYGRKQGLSVNNNSNYLLIPLMISKGFKCKVLDNPNIFLFSSGFVLEFDSDKDLIKIKDIIESDKFYNYVKEQGKPWAGKKEYFSFTSTLLKRFNF